MSHIKKLIEKCQSQMPYYHQYDMPCGTCGTAGYSAFKLSDYTYNIGRITYVK